MGNEYIYSILLFNSFIFNMFRINDRFQHLLASGTCHGSLDYVAEILIIVGCCLLGIIWAIVQIIAVEKIDVMNDTGLGGQAPQSTVP